MPAYRFWRLFLTFRRFRGCLDAEKHRPRREAVPARSTLSSGYGRVVGKAVAKERVMKIAAAVSHLFLPDVRGRFLFPFELRGAMTSMLV